MTFSVGFFEIIVWLSLVLNCLTIGFFIFKFFNEWKEGSIW